MNHSKLTLTFRYVGDTPVATAQTFRNQTRLAGGKLLSNGTCKADQRTESGVATGGQSSDSRL